MDHFERTLEILKMLKSIKESLHLYMQSQMKDVILTGPQGMLVGLLIHQENLRMSELAEHMGLSPSTVSELVDRMEKMDIVKRTRSHEDGRVVLVQLSESFREASQERIQRIESVWAEKINDATDEELNKIKDGLGALERLLKKGDQND